ncbi:autophagy-related protein 16 isoform X1 [Helicoverpa armigera]|uniref:autophagy-related protein 16 isoform X1 n=1 Tax=Helicoverpa armigera TaxID=29058 RepID=UPI000B389364|nr:autophagy-related protein 16 isoform X1 [Helicoverpa armigera]XP_047025700.1 autophagy-related protein 16 isoform X1 [Helicoverpa zea]
MEGGEWRSNIVSQLQARNKYETAAFQDIIAFQSRLFDNVNTLKNENLQLTLLNERIRFSGTDSVLSGTGTASNERIQALEQKILVQQEELTSMHRRRGEHAQQIMSLNEKVHDLEKQLQAKDIVISENTAVIASLRAEIQMYETNMAELQGLNQVLRDEHQALQIAFAAIEEKLRKAQDENRSLVERLIKYKAKDADKMNEENEHFLKSSNPTAFLINTFGRVSFGKKTDKVRKELEEAARESGSRSSGSGSSEDKILDSMPYYATVLPNKVALRFDAHDGEVNAVKWSPTDRIVATGGADRKVKLWDVTKSMVENRGTLVGSNAGVMSVDFDSTGAYIVGASNDFASRVWTVADQRLRHTLTGHSGKVMAAKFLGEPTKVITGSHDRTLKIWDLRSKMCTETKFAGSSCNDLVTSDGAGSTIISGHFDKRIRFWDIRTEMSANDIMLQGKVTSLDLSRDNNYLLACVRDDTIQLIDLRMNTIVRSFSHEAFKVGCDWSRAAFGPGGRLLSVGAADGAAYVWNTHSGRLETILKDHTSAVTAVSWHPQSGLLASVDRGKRAIIWGDL